MSDLGCDGHCTHIKLSDVSLAGIKKAFNDPRARIRYDTTVPVHPAARLLGISFEGGSFDGEALGFSDNLTTLIGGRGTGKSAVIEAIRFLFQQPTTSLPSRLQQDVKERLDFTLRDTVVRAIYQDSAENIYVLKRRHGEDGTDLFDLAGQPQPAIELPKSETVRVEVYGWSEIEALGDSSRKQLDLLDRYISDAEGLKLEVAQKRSELKTIDDAIIALAQEISNLLPSVSQASEIEAELARLSNPELDSAFKDFDTNQKAELALTRLLKAMEELEAKLSLKKAKAEDDKVRFCAPFAEALEAIRSSLMGQDWWDETEKALRKSSEHVEDLYRRLEEALSSMKQQITAGKDRLATEKVAIEGTLNSLAEKSGQKDFQAALSRRQQLSERANEIRDKQADIKQKQARLTALLSDRKAKAIPAFEQARAALYEKRIAKAEAIAAKLATLKGTSKIQIQLLPLGERSQFARSLGRKEKGTTVGLLKNIDKQYLSKDFPGYLSARLTPHEFVTPLLENVENAQALNVNYVRVSSGLDKGKIVRLVEGKVRVDGSDLVEESDSGAEIGRWSAASHECVQQEVREKIWRHLSPYFSENEIQLYPDVKKLTELLKLDMCDIEDKPVITLDDRPIEELSPGQRCSALIPVVLMEGNVPLVIDQPEDNLDNKLIFDLVVDILRGLKEQRQVIVATHNPNIPVSGDAEQVIIFDSPSKERCRAVTHGSIDDEDVVKHIRVVMEGGDKAFEMRMKKYGYKLKAN